MPPFASYPQLAALGVTCLEVMPVCEFPGKFNWGYDGVDLYAPFHGYGDPHAFRRFVDAAHALQLGVILDVVYNHLGASGNYLSCFSADYFTDRYPNEWGEAINFDGASAAPCVNSLPGTRRIGSVSSISMGSASTPRRASTTPRVLT